MHDIPDLGPLEVQAVGARRAGVGHVELDVPRAGGGREGVGAAQMLAAAEEAIDGGRRARIIAALRRLTGAQVDDQPRSATRFRIGGRA
jgi:hypothetical protein